MRQWTVRDVMTTKVVTVRDDVGYKAVVDLLASAGISAVPVVDGSGTVIGIVSEADLLRKVEFLGAEDDRRVFERPSRRAARARAHGDTVADLMSAPAVTIRPEEPVAAAARLMDAERVKRLPVVDDNGRLVGIVSRRDLVGMYLRPDAQIRADVIDTILTSTLWLDPAAVTADVADGVVTLRGTVDRRSTADLAVRLTRSVPGVVNVHDELACDYDDSADTANRFYRSHPFSSTQQQPQ